MSLPDFIIIGAMKCGTSTLQAQLAAQAGIFMTTPKEPNFFSDDEIYGRGMGWYAALFEGAMAGDLKGEASTHYTKLPTHPDAAARLHAAAPGAKLIYLMRHPIDRLVSHYIHEWTMGAVSGDIDAAAQAGSAFVTYSEYSKQLAPYLDRYGEANILPLFLERMNAFPDEELKRVAAFLGGPAEISWRHDFGAQNVSRERIRRFPLYNVLVDSAPATALRRAIAPKALRNWVKSKLQMRERPSLSADTEAVLEAVFDADLKILGTMLGEDLSCATFKERVSARPLNWAPQD